MNIAISRRHFAAGAGLTALAAGRVTGANDRVRLGVIGVGRRANLLIDQLPAAAEIVAVADCFPRRCEEAAARRHAQWRVYSDHRQLLDQKDVDGVIVATPDHGRVLCAIHAAQAGKDIYAEKPLSLYVEEGRVLVRAVRKYNRILQVGSQQRSMAMNRVACDFVRNGGLGKIDFVMGAAYSSPIPYPAEGLPVDQMPEGLNWDVWIGQSPMRPFNSDMFLHWMKWFEYSGREMTDWGAHGLDQVQSALGMDHTGPAEFWPLSEGPRGKLAFRYANGVTVRLELPEGQINGGAMFVGAKGRVELWRNDFRTDPPDLIKDLPPKEEVVKWNRAQYQAEYHMQDWLECMRSRKLPLADVEIGHRTVSVCHLANLTRQLNRKLQWDPEAERFRNDPDANQHLARPRREGYELPVV